MTRCFFVSDIHGRVDRYAKLFQAIELERPRVLFIGGDILAHFGRREAPPDFIRSYLLAELESLRLKLGSEYPRVFIILGNDDLRINEEALLDERAAALVSYVHMRKAIFDEWAIYGYSMVPPTPFRLKDWERYDVSRYVDPGSVSPEEGMRSVPADEHEVRYGTIAGDLQELTGADDLLNAVLLFHGPPYGTGLDRAQLDDMTVDHVPLDVHIGSVAICRFIEERQPWLTLHGHVHESARITGVWLERMGRTVALSAAHDGRELALVRFDLEDPGGATRDLI
jgi:uncharacterized protein